MSKAVREAMTLEPIEAARLARLRYLGDNGPGISRRRAGKGFSYTDAKGQPIRDPEILARIKSLAIPPAWTDVWISPAANGHIQATGRDARGRKQYRYHPRWRAVRDENKYERTIAFGMALPRIRKRVEHDLALPGLPRARVLATVVRLLETTYIRVGNEEYAKQNRSFGLTTMHDRHVDISGTAMRFEFRGKSGVKHHVEVRDRKLAAIVRRCRDIPGYELFQYIDDDGKRQTIDSADVNEYLHEISGQEFTAKDFRTWTGTMLAALALQEFEAFDCETQAKKNIVRAIESVAEQLGNTPAVCRKCYVHPSVLDAYLDGATAATLKHRIAQELGETLHDLKPEEAAVMALLQARLSRESSEGRKAG